MKVLTLLFVSSLITLFVQAQHNYTFGGNLSEQSGGPALQEILACSAAPGSFGADSINTSTGSCNGGTPATTFRFNAGGGVQYTNPNQFVSGSYTIHVFFKFNELGGYSRIIDFSNSTSDNGIYLLGNCLNFYPNGNVGPTCPFVPNKFYLLSFSRDSVSKVITVYVDGVLYSTFNDVNNLYVSPGANTPVNFFRDDNVVTCEVKAGSVKYLSVTRTPSTAEQVNTVFTNICTLALPVTWRSFTGSIEGKRALLNWSTETESNTSYYAVEHAINAADFREVGRVVAAGNVSRRSDYSFTHLLVSNDNYYRLKQVDKDGRFTYSGILKLSHLASFGVFPNPAKGMITISGMVTNSTITLSTTEGKKLLVQKASGQTTTINLRTYAPGTYLLQYWDGKKVQVQKIVRE